MKFIDFYDFSMKKQILKSNLLVMEERLLEIPEDRADCREILRMELLLEHGHGER